jgi:hypothetical protein
VNDSHADPTLNDPAVRLAESADTSASAAERYQTVPGCVNRTSLGGWLASVVRDAWSAVFSNDGRFIFAHTLRPATAADIDVIALDSARTRTTAGAESGRRGGAEWVAYQSKRGPL